MGLTRRLGFAAAAAALAMAACGEEEAIAPPADVESAPQPLRGTLDWAIAGEWRSLEHRERDAALKPVELFDIAGVDVDLKVLELWPGSGWAAEILAPYLANGGGSMALGVPPAEPGAEVEELNSRLRERFADTAVFGDVRFAPFGADTGPVAEESSVDLILSLRDVHAWMALDFADKAFADAFAALKPGGTFIVVEARAAEGGVQDPAAPTGYVKPSYIRRLAEDAGFEHVRSHEIYANPADDHDHPFGVWTLAPYDRSSPLGAPPDPAFERSPYDAVGEPDQVVLTFRKPAR